jgi:hypothetical protein
MYVSLSVWDVRNVGVGTPDERDLFRYNLARWGFTVVLNKGSVPCHMQMRGNMRFEI